MKKIKSGRLQDIEATLEILKKSGVPTKFFLRLSLPYILIKGITDKQWIKILEFERKQEIERIKFFNTIK